MKKSVCQRIHAKRRAVERYSLDLNRQDLRNIVTVIQSNKATPVEKQSHRVTVFDLTYNEVDVRVVYDKQRKTIVTFLPKEDL